MTALTDQPGSPVQRRSLKGESIRSLREHLQLSLSCTSLPDLSPVPSKERDDKEDENTVSTASSTSTTTASAATTTTTNKPTPATGRNANEVRKRLLQNLGIQKPSGGGISPTPSSTMPNTSNNTSNSEPWGPTTEVPLNENTNDPATPSKLRFCQVVQVHPIPSYKVYSNRIQETIWTNAYELREQVARNTLEFSYEHWDANQVLDEDNGLIYHEGEWIHPVHVDFEGYEDYVGGGGGETDENGEPTKLSSEEELWILTCERLGIKPAAFYHSIPTIPTKQQLQQVSGKKVPGQ